MGSVFPLLRSELEAAKVPQLTQQLAALLRASFDDLTPGDDVLVRFAQGPKGLVVAEIHPSDH